MEKLIRGLSPEKRVNLAKMLLRSAGESAPESTASEPIAIIGVGCRFPGGVNSPESFWTLLREGVDAVQEVPASRWDINAYYDADPAVPGKMYTRNGAFLDGVDLFDPYFFGIPPRSAVNLDPQHRLLLEVAWEALENAGIAPRSLAGSKTGIFVGGSTGEYTQLMRDKGAANIDASHLTGSLLTFATGRLSHFLDLQGPSLTVDTACSSSLVAVHLACQSLRSGESSLALVGGVNLVLMPQGSITTSKARMLAVDGRCKTFDASADGYGRGEGCGLVVLKRLSEALKDEDNILAVIRGTATNQDGHSSDLTVPNGLAQQQVIRKALENAGLQPEQVDYVEAHGTGTALGDPIEMRALGAVFGPTRDASQPLRVGSVKTNIGHLEYAAGIAGLIKLALSLNQREIPAHLHFKRGNPYIPWNELPVEIPTQRVPWAARQGRRVAGVSSFGASGTNAHVVLEEAPEVTRDAEAPVRPLQVLALSARTAEELRELAARYATHLEAHPEARLEEVCFTANAGRTHFAHRAALVTPSLEQLREQVKALARGETPEQGAVGQAGREREAVFLFTGQGSLSAGSGKELFDTEPGFRDALKRCDELLRPLLGESLLEVLHESRGALLKQASVAQPALFSLEYALAQQWKAWGVKPAAVLGHSLGEYVAACVAGALSLEDALRLVVRRGQLMEELAEPGKMVVVMAEEAQVQQALKGREGRVSVAAVNGPRETVVSGAEREVDAVVEQLKQRGVESRALQTTHAFHSPLMQPMLEKFRGELGRVKWNKPEVELVLNLTGQPARGEELGGAEYWLRQVREPVRFWQGLQGLYERGHRLFVEVGPRPTLVAVGRKYLGEEAEWVGSLKPGVSDWAQLLGGLSRLYARGVEVDWSALGTGVSPRRTSLPTYPFQRQRYWIERSRGQDGHARSDARGPWVRKISSPVLKETVFECAVSTNLFPFLAEHQVHGVTVLPSTVYMELVRAAAREVFGEGAHALEDMLIQEMLALRDDTEHLLQLVLSPRTDDTRSFQLFSARTEGAPSQETPWVLHATGTLRKALQGSPVLQAPTLEALRARCSQDVPTTALRAHAQALGIHYGPGFQGLERLHRGAAEALGWVRLPEALASEPTRFPLHPALLDACLQVCGGPLVGEEEKTDTLYLPMGFQRLQVWREPGTACWSHVSLRPRDASAEGVLTADLRLLDESGAVCAVMEGLRFQRVGRAALQRLVHAGSQWTYAVRWETTAREAITRRTPEGTWLVLADSSGTGDALARSLRAQGERCVVVRPGASYSVQEGGTVTVNPTRVEDFTRLFQDVSGCRGIVHLWGTQADAPMSQEARRPGWESVLHLTQALVRGNLPVMPRLWLVTRGTQRTGLESTPPSLAQSPLWGLGRTLALEHPEVSTTLVDLEPSALPDTSAEAAALLAELYSAPRGEQLAHRQGQRYAARLARHAMADTRSSSPRLRADGTYLITGGLGGLGLQVAKWLVERGARHLLLMGRQAPGAAAQESLRALRQAGAAPLVVLGDVSQAGDVARVLASFDPAKNPLRGVMHLAGVVEDGTLLNQDPSRFERVLAPKQAGAWNLHEQTRGLDLDFFVLFSSSASLLGAVGQGNYAAANAFLDTLAQHRRALGLKAVSVQWGGWSGHGMAAAVASPEQRREAGWIEPERGLEALGQLLVDGPATVAVLPMDWNRYVQRFTGAAGFLRELLEPTRAGASGPREATLAERLKGLTRVRQQEALLDHVHQLVRQVLGASASRSLAGGDRLFDAGMDSLMALELRGRFQAHLGVERPLSATLVFDHPTIDALTQHLATEILGLEPLSVSAAPVPDAAEVTKQAVESLEQLPPDELGALLDQKLAALEKLVDGT